MDKELICRCSNCNSEFQYSETKLIEYDLYGNKKFRKVCPYCNSESYSPSELDYFYDRLGKNKKLM